GVQGRFRDRGAVQRAKGGGQPHLPQGRPERQGDRPGRQRRQQDREVTPPPFSRDAQRSARPSAPLRVAAKPLSLPRPRSRYSGGMAHTNILGPGGAIARRLSNYESRPEQLDMADAVARAIAERRHLMVEAGTGVGKSFAYLVPAILAALADKDCRVVISTHTISLQEQLLRKDIPFLQSVMPQEFKAVLVKGRANYLSVRRLRVAQQRLLTLAPDRQAADQLVQIGKWSRR